MLQATEVIPYLLGAARGLGLVLFLPLGWDLVAVAQRLALALGFALGIPVPIEQIGEHGIVAWTIVGMLIGAPFALVTDIAASVGELVDAARGITIAEVLDPLQSTTTSHLAVLNRYAVWVCFLASGGTAHLIRVVGETRATTLPSVAESGAALLVAVAALCTDAFLSVAPALLLFLACELSIALITRVGSNISLSTEALILKLAVFTAVATQIVAAFDVSWIAERLHV